MKNFLTVLLGVSMMACTQVKTSQILLTSEAGAKCEEQSAIKFVPAEGETPAGAIIINTEDERQTIDGYGVSLTESSAFVLASVSEEDRAAILHEFFSEEGANFPIVRTQIGASDFSVEGNYSLCEQAGDTALTSFSLDRDKEGFSKSQYPCIKNEHYDLYHLMKEVAAIRANQKDNTYRILANTWTAPAWMKDNGKYYQRGMENGQWVARGGKLLKQYYDAYARYLLRYLQAWKEEGVEIWAMTPVNEPMGNDGGWESMELSAEAEAEFIAQYMGPTLAENGFGDVQILGFDQNIFEMGPYTAAIYGNEQANAYTTGMALHWYGSTFSCFPEVLDSIHALYPEKTLIHTEGCIDNLGCPAWDAVTDPAGFTESNWFNNDSFWWTASATDWAYSTPYWPELHPAYSAVQRYAQYIIDGVNHWMTGFIDWNCALDEIGGPNHVSNFCGAPLMISTDEEGANTIYFTPYYYALKQFSRSMRPGDIALGVTENVYDGLHLCAVKKQDGSIAINMLNKTEEPISFPLEVAGYRANITAPANSVQTMIVKL